MQPGQWELDINWTEPRDDGGAKVTAYDLRRKQSSAPDEPQSWTDVPNIWASGSGGLEYTLGGLDNGTSYDIQVRAVNPAGPGTWSVTGEGIPRTTPGRPAITAVEAVHQSLEIGWTSPLDNGGNEISAYDVRRKRTLDPDVPASWTEILGVWKSGESKDLTYQVGGLANGTSYDVQIRAVNDAGAGTWSLSDSGTPVTVPGAPAIVSVEPFDQSLEFSWFRPTFDGFAGINSYDLRHKKSGDPDLPRFWTEAIGVRTGSGELEYTLTGLANGTAYDLQVRAVNDAGAGGWSATRAGTPRTAPDPPSVSSVTAGDRSLTIRWQAPPKNGGAEITSYDLRSKRSQDPDVPSSWKEELERWTTGAGALEFTLTRLANGTPYDIQVRAENSAGGSDWSGTAPGTPVGVPLAPAITNLAAEDRTLTVAWDPPSDLGGNTLEGFSIRYKASSAPDSNRSWTDLIDAWRTGTALEYSIDQLQNGRSYDVQVRVETGADPGPWSQLRSATPRTVPPAPQVQSVDPLDRSLLVKWQAPSGNGGAEITAYDIRYKRQSHPGSWAEIEGIWQTGGRASEYILSPGSGLTNGTAYDVRLRAVNIAGSGAWSGSAPGTPATLPQAPVPAAAEPGRGSLELSWNPPAGDGGSEIIAYDLRHKRSSSPDTDPSWTLVDRVWETGDGALEHTQSLAGSTSFNVQLRAVNAVGPGPWSGSITATTGARGGGGGGGGRRPPEPVLPAITYTLKVLDNRFERAPGNLDLQHNIPDLEVTLPNGEVVTADFLGHFLETGELTRWGYPTSEVLVLEDGTLTQFYQRGVVDFHNLGSGWVVERRLAWDYVGGGAGGSPDQGVEPGVTNPHPGTLLGPWGHKVSDFAIDGTQVSFASFFNSLGGVGAFGLPKTDAREDTGASGTLLEPGKTLGFIRQYFQAAIFQFNAAGAIEITLLGDTLRGVLVPDFAEHLPFTRAEPLVRGQAFEPYAIPQLADA